MTANAITPAISLVKQAHELIRQHLQLGDIVVDATVGNGHDTLFLMELVAPNGKVFGFDIQPAAISATQALINSSPYADNTLLICADHADMGKHIPKIYHGKVKAVMFNLGYLPGGDKRIITQAHSTLAALTTAINLLAAGGILTILAYPGHVGGNEETEQVKFWCARLNHEQFTCQLIRSATEKPSAPVLYVINKNY